MLWSSRFLCVVRCDLLRLSCHVFVCALVSREREYLWFTEG
jgi:hypothetical protein